VAVAVTTSGSAAGLRLRAREVAWRVLVGTAAGAISGFLVGGVGGRLAMLLLRLTSPELVIGLESDDGFEIGVVSSQTFNLLFATAGLGGVVGALYAGVRGAIPARLRLPLWTGFWTLVGGAGLVHDDGIDFALLEPHWLAVALFVAIPGIAAVILVLLAERWSSTPAWQSRRLTTGLAAAAAVSLFALVASAIVAAVMLAVLLLLDRLGPHADRVRAGAGVAVLLLLVTIGVFAALDLASETRTILE
jgi:hypothetical protein